MGDRIQLQQVLLNLIINGIEAMSGAGHSPRELWVSSEKQPAMPAESRADNFESERRFVRDHPTKPDEVGTPKVPAPARPAPNAKLAHVSVSVADSGPGLDTNNVDRLF